MVMRKESENGMRVPGPSLQGRGKRNQSSGSNDGPSQAGQTSASPPMPNADNARNTQQGGTAQAQQQAANNDGGLRRNNQREPIGPPAPDADRAASMVTSLRAGGEGERPSLRQYAEDRFFGGQHRTDPSRQARLSNQRGEVGQSLSRHDVRGIRAAGRLEQQRALRDAEEIENSVARARAISNITSRDFGAEAIESRLQGMEPNAAAQARAELGLRAAELGSADDQANMQHTQVMGTLAQQEAQRQQEGALGVAGLEMQARQLDQEQQNNIREHMRELAEQNRQLFQGTPDEIASDVETWSPATTNALQRSGVEVDDETVRRNLLNTVNRGQQEIRSGQLPEDFDQSMFTDLAMLNTALAETEDQGGIAGMFGRDEVGESFSPAQFLNRVDQLVASGEAGGWFSSARGEADGTEFEFGGLEGPAAQKFHQMVQQRARAIMSRDENDPLRQQLVQSTVEPLNRAIETTQAQIENMQQSEERRSERREEEAEQGSSGPGSTLANRSLQDPQQRQEERQQLQQRLEQLREDRAALLGNDAEEASRAVNDNRPGGLRRNQ